MADLGGRQGETQAFIQNHKSLCISAKICFLALLRELLFQPAAYEVLACSVMKRSKSKNSAQKVGLHSA